MTQEICALSPADIACTRSHVVVEQNNCCADNTGVRWVRLGCMIETPLGVLRVTEMCSEMQLREQQGRFRRGTSRPSLTTLCMGFADLGKELHAPYVPGRLNVATSAQLCVLAARAYGLSILDGVHLGAR